MAKKKSKKAPKSERYREIIEKIFFDHFKTGCTEIEFDRNEIEAASRKLKVPVPKNVGDVLYSFRYRRPLPQRILDTETSTKQWIIEGIGRARYRFRLSSINRIVPSDNAYRIKIPDSTPEIINAYAKSDEQALLAKVRYNRLIDVFLRITAYSLQNHLRTTVPGIGQIEVDELYVGVRDTGQQFIVPVQAKGGTDRLAATQIYQDFELCKHAFPALTPRSIAVQFIDDDTIAMFEIVFQQDELRVAKERHYCLVPADRITDEDLKTMSELEGD